MIMGENIPHVIYFETQGLKEDGLFDEGRQPNLNRSSLLPDSIDELSRATMRVSGLHNEGTSAAQTGSIYLPHKPSSRVTMRVRGHFSKRELRRRGYPTYLGALHKELK